MTESLNRNIWQQVLNLTVFFKLPTGNQVEINFTCSDDNNSENKLGGILKKAAHCRWSLESMVRKKVKFINTSASHVKTPHNHYLIALVKVQGGPFKSPKNFSQLPILLWQDPTIVF